jgi:hypothetical protein
LRIIGAYTDLTQPPGINQTTRVQSTDSWLEKPFILLRRHAGRPLAWLGLPLLLYIWTLGGPFCFDDLHLVLKTQKYVRGESQELGLFRFAPDQASWDDLRSRGNYPWWSPAIQRIDFLRPLAEWSFYLDMRLFGPDPRAHRAVSLLLFALVLCLLNLLYRAASGDVVQAGAAALLFGVSQCVTQPVTFVCNRADLFVLMGISVSATSYLRLKQQEKKTPMWIGIGLLGFAFALAAKEIAVAWVAVPILYEGYGRFRKQPLQSSPIIFGISMLLLAGCYLVFYASTRMHPGSASTGSDRLAYLAQIPRSLPLYLGVWTLGFPINLLAAAPDYVAWLIIAVALLLLCFVIPPVARIVRTQFAAAFFAGWSLSFMSFALLTSPEVRALSIATVGWSFILAMLLLPTPHNPQPAFHNSQSIGLFLRHWLFTANFGISIACAIGIVLFSNHAELEARAAISGYLHQLKTPLRDGDVLIVGKPNSPLELLAAADRLEIMTGVKNVSLVFLVFPNLTGGAKRVDDHLITAGASLGPLIDAEAMKLSLGRNYVPNVGDRFTTSLFEAQIDGLTNGEIKELSFRFGRSLSDPSLHLLKIE